MNVLFPSDFTLLVRYMEFPLSNCQSSNFNSKERKSQLKVEALLSAEDKLSEMLREFILFNNIAIECGPYMLQLNEAVGSGVQQGQGLLEVLQWHTD